MTGASRRTTRISRGSARPSRHNPPGRSVDLAVPEEKQLFEDLRHLADDPGASVEAINTQLAVSTDDEVRRTMIGQFLVRALYNDRPDHLLLWSMVAAMQKPGVVNDRLRKTMRDFATRR